MKMTLRDKLALQSPITFDMALKFYGDPNANLNDDSTRRCFLSVWTYLQYEYADMMLWQRKQDMK